MTDYKVIKCDVCDKLMRIPPIEGVAIGLSVPETHPEYEEVSSTFGKTIFNICWVCWIKVFGIKTLDDQL